jgi:eukaryotic-like serine/threonine-protein kinase
MAMPDTKRCAECGTPLPAYWPKGLCARCALDGALDMSHAVSQVVKPAFNAPAELIRPRSSPESSPLGSFGEYDLLDEIARGGMGVVYRARQRNLGRVVAVKMILAGSLAGKEFVQRFRTESAAAAILQHPNIVAIHDVGVHDGRHYFSMDYVEGQNLAQLVGQQPLPASKAARHAQIIAEAIHYAHERGILHRDLKPSNVLIDAANDQPRITDFGLARRLDGDSSLTLTGQVLGSPNFMPPEQAGGGRGKVSRPSDVYALGGILYHLLTARAPFQADSLDRLLTQVLHAEPVSPRLLNPSVPRDLETITLKCLEKEPSRRYPTARELADELGRFLRHEPIHARPITAPQKLWRWSRRKPALALLILLVHMVGATGLGGILWQWRRAENHAASERLERIAGQRQLYVATMNLVQAAWEQNQTSRSRQLLEQTANSAERGFEWFYWQRQLHFELMTLRGHSAPVLGVAYSPDGQQLVTASSDTTARVWDAASGRFLFALNGHLGPLRSVAYLPNSQGIVTGSWDNTARIWDAATGVELFSLEGHAGPIFSVAVSTNGQRIATASLDGTARVWDATTRSVVTEFRGHHTNLWAVAFSPDGERIVSGGWDKMARVWDASGGQEQLRLEGHRTAVFAATFSPDGKLIVTGGEDGTVKLWDAATHPVLGDAIPPKLSLVGHTAPVFSVAFSPDGQYVLSAGDDQTARLWNATNGALVRVIKGHGSRIGSAAFSPDGRRIVTTGGAVRYSPQGQIVIPTQGDEPTAKVWDAEEERASLTLEGHSGHVSSLGFSPDGRRLVSGSFDGTARVWDLDRRGEGIVVGRHGEIPVRSVAFLPDGKRIVTGSFDRTARVWDVASRRELYRLEGHAKSVFSVAASSDGRWLATGIEDNSNCVRVWDAATGRLAFIFDQHSCPVRAISFSPDGQLIASAGEDGVVKLWDPMSGKERLTFHGPWAIWAVAFSRDSRRLVTGSGEQPAIVWDALNGAKQLILEGHTAHIHGAAFSPDGRRIVTGSADRTAKLWDAVSGKELLTFRGHTGWIFAVAFSPDGQRIVTGSGDGTIKVWEAASREQVAKWQAEERAAVPLEQALANPR